MLRLREDARPFEDARDEDARPLEEERELLRGADLLEEPPELPRLEEDERLLLAADFLLRLAEDDERLADEPERPDD